MGGKGVLSSLVSKTTQESEKTMAVETAHGGILTCRTEEAHSAVKASIETGDSRDGGATDGLITETIAFWRTRAGVELTPEEARQAISDVAGFFNLLDQYERKLARPSDPTVYQN
jgi:hypothetical protein